MRKTVCSAMCAALSTTIAAAPTQAPQIPPPAIHQTQLEAWLSVYGADVLSEFAVDYCYANAPTQAPAARAAWHAWRKKFLVAEVPRHADAAAMAGMRESMQPSRAVLHAGLAREGTPSEVCRKMPSSFSDADMDMRTQYPVAYNPKARVVPPSQPGMTTAVAPGTAAAPQAPTTAQAPSRTAALPPLVRGKVVPASRLRTAPGQGIPARDIEAVMYEKNFPMILLKDGWLYCRKSGIPPSDLNVAVSREFEPLHWRPWKRINGVYHMRITDNDGKFTSDWVKVPGWSVKPWPKAHIADFLTKASFTGSMGLGGTYQQNSWHFETSGRFESRGYTQSSAGSWAAANGYSSAQTTVRGGDGTRSTSTVLAGGAPATSTQAAGSSFTEGRRINDGSNYKGSYTIEGYTLDLRYDSGRMERVMAFPWSEKGTSYIDGETFLRPSN